MESTDKHKLDPRFEGLMTFFDKNVINVIKVINVIINVINEILWLVWQYAQPRKFKMTHFGKVVHFGVLPVRNPLETSGINGEFDVDFL